MTSLLNKSSYFGRDMLRTILIVGYCQVVLGVVLFGVLFLRTELGWKVPNVESAISRPLLPGLYFVAVLQGKVTPGPGTPLPLILGLALNCVFYSTLWLAVAALWRRLWHLSLIHI